MACVQFTNYAFTELATAINASQTSITVTSSASFLFQGSHLGAGDWFYVTLKDSNSFNANLNPPSTYEIIKVTAVNYSTNVWTVVRAQDSTSGTVFSACDYAVATLPAAAL